MPIAEQLAGEVLGLFQEPYTVSIKARVLPVKLPELELRSFPKFRDQFQGKKLPWGRQLMPTDFSSIPRVRREPRRDPHYSFALRIRVCPITGHIHLASVEATIETLAPQASGSPERVYVLPLLLQGGRMCEVYVIAEISGPRPSRQAVTHGTSNPTTRRRPRTPGLCGGVVALPEEHDELEAAPAEMRQRVEQEYDRLLERLTLASAARAVHA